MSVNHLIATSPSEAVILLLRKNEAASVAQRLVAKLVAPDNEIKAQTVINTTRYISAGLYGDGEHGLELAAI